NTAPIIIIEDELRRWQLLLIGPYRPVRIVDIERRRRPYEVKVGRPVGVDRADVAPISLSVGSRLDTAVLETVRSGEAPAHHMRDDGLAEIVTRWRVGGR